MSVREDFDSPKRHAIVAAATDLFAARGYGAVSMDSIARAADVSKATLYAHFESKDRLFATIVQGACRDSLAPGEGLPDAGADVAAALLAIGGRILRFLLTDRALAIHRLVVAECPRFPELGHAFYDNGLVAGLASWIARQSALEAPDPERASGHFLSLLRSGLHFRATLGLVQNPADAEIDATVDDAVRIFLLAYGRMPLAAVP